MKKNIFKKIVASLATVAMAAGLFTAMPAEEAKAADTVTMTIKVTGELVASANSMNFYNWVPNETLGGWPGSAMTKESQGVFSIDITVPASTQTISGKFNGDVESNDITGIEVKKKVATVTIASDKSYTIAYSGEDLVTVDLDANKETKNIQFFVKLDGTTNEKMYAHVWEDGFEGSKVTGWPGHELTLTDGIYTATIPVEKSEDAVKAIIHNESEGIKTENLDVDITTGKVYFTVKAEDSTVTVSTSKPASWTSTEDSTQSSQATQSTGETGTKGNSETTTAADKTTTKAPETTTEAKKGIEVEVTLSADAKWDKVFIYAFPEGEGLKGWPGVEMTAKDGKWYATLDTTATKLSYVISNGNGEQTVDVKDVEGKNVKITLGAKNAEGKFEASAKAVTAGGTGSAKPGDAAPIVMMFAVAAVAAGMVVASKKKTICE